MKEFKNDVLSEATIIGAPLKFFKTLKYQVFGFF